MQAQGKGEDDLSCARASFCLLASGNSLSMSGNAIESTKRLATVVSWHPYGRSRMIRLFILAAVGVVIAGCGEGTSQSSDNSGANKNNDHLKTMEEIDSAFNQGRYDFVVKHARSYIDEYPESGQAWLVLGWAYLKQDNIEKAKECFEAALSIDSSSDNAHVGLGVVHRRCGRNELARESYKEAIRLCPENPEAFSSILVIELIEGRYDEAITYGETAWQLRKDLASVPANLCIAYHYKGNTSQRDYFYKKAEELKYRNMDALDDIIAGRTTIGNPPDKSLSRTLPAKGPEGSK